MPFAILVSSLGFLPPAQVSVEFVVTAPKETPADAHIFVAGNTTELGAWRADGLPMTRGEDGKHRATFKAEKGATLEFKFTLGSWDTVEKGEGGRELVNRRLTVDRDMRHEFTVVQWAAPHKTRAKPTLTGDIRTHKDFPSKFLGNQRTLIVYVPPLYDARPDERYPVLYMHDGQNLFDATTSFAGVEWQADETAERLIKAGKISPIIIVGIYNNADRVNEYTPWPDTRQGQGGKGDKYARFVIDEVKPFIDKTYRTKPGREHTAVAGSSLGGLISLYLATTEPDTYSMVGVISPALMWGGRRAIRDLEADPAVLQRLRLWIDMGTEETREIAAFKKAIDETRRLADLCKLAGLRSDRDFVYKEIPGGRHNENAWSERFDQVLLFFFGAWPQ
jgi:predicted alpha/beta superfamily hydrolase